MTFRKPYDSVSTNATMYRWQKDWVKKHLRRGDTSFMLQEAVIKVIMEKDPVYFKKFDKKIS